jgi:hypothetical protein
MTISLERLEEVLFSWFPQTRQPAQKNQQGRFGSAGPEQLLCACPKRPNHRAAAEKNDELAPPGLKLRMQKYIAN